MFSNVYELFKHIFIVAPKRKYCPSLENVYLWTHNFYNNLLHFARVVDDGKCIVVTRLYESVCLCVCSWPHAYTIARTRMELGWVVGDAHQLCIIGRICNRGTGCIAMATYRECEMLASTYLYSLYAYFPLCFCIVFWLEVVIFLRFAKALKLATPYS